MGRTKISILLFIIAIFIAIACAAVSSPTAKPSSKSSTGSPVVLPTKNPTPKPSSTLPSVKPTSRAPSSKPTSIPTKTSPSTSPNLKPVSKIPTFRPSTSPTLKPVSKIPTFRPTSNTPSTKPITTTKTPTTTAPTTRPTAKSSTFLPTTKPSTSNAKPSSRTPTLTTVPPTSSPTDATLKLFNTFTSKHNVRFFNSTHREDAFKTFSGNLKAASILSNNDFKCGVTKFSYLTTEQYRSATGIDVFGSFLQQHGKPSAKSTVKPSRKPSKSTAPSALMPGKNPIGKPNSARSKRPAVGGSKSKSPKKSSSFYKFKDGRGYTFTDDEEDSDPNGEPVAEPIFEPTNYYYYSEPTPEPTAEATESLQIESPTAQPTDSIQRKSKRIPTVEPTFEPTQGPYSDSNAPTTQSKPVFRPTASPTKLAPVFPTKRVSVEPTKRPVSIPQASPSKLPSGEPSKRPTLKPQASPSKLPSGEPSKIPALKPQASPSKLPSVLSSKLPQRNPTTQPNQIPLTGAPIITPTSSRDWSSPTATPFGAAITPIKDQGQCGSCWAFSSVGAIEGAYAIKYNKPPLTFSEQQLVSCDTAEGGCNGGWPPAAMLWVGTVGGGLALEANYPYTGTESVCKTSVQKEANTKTVSNVEVANTFAAMKAALDIGPVTVTVAASSQVWQMYTSGVLSSTTCGTSVDHAILAVGYGVDATTGKTFIKCKNSWGTGWGEKGYVRIWADETANICAIYSNSYYPILQ